MHSGSLPGATVPSALERSFQAMLRRLLIGSGLHAARATAILGASAAGTIVYAASSSCDSCMSRPILFFSDLDQTLVGDDEAGLGEWCTYWQEEERAKHGSILCFNTGRCIKDYETELKLAACARRADQRRRP